MPDGSVLGYNGDPNEVVEGDSSGQTLIYHCPVGTRYQEDDGTQWYKKSLQNVWEKINADIGWSHDHVYNEEPEEDLDGIKKTFPTKKLFISGTTRVFLNGLRIKLGVEYIEGEQSITFFEAPEYDDSVIFDYVIKPVEM